MRITIGITSGDPAGIGLEVILKSIASVHTLARWILFTDRSIFERNAVFFDPPISHRWIKNISGVTEEPILFLLDLGGDTSAIEWGRLSMDAGRRALSYLDAASSEALRGNIHGIVTAPVSKEAIGPHFHGQTDFL